MDKNETPNLSVLSYEGNYEKIREILEKRNPFVELSKTSMTKSERDKIDDYKKIIYYACLGGHTRILQLLIENYNVKFYNPHIAMYNAGFANHEDIIELLYKDYDMNIDHALYGACKGGHVRLFKKILKKYDFSAEDIKSNKITIFEYACKGGHEDMINFLIKNDLYDWNHGFIGACEGGQLEIVKWLYKEHKSELDIYDVFTHGTIGGNLQLILWGIEMVEQLDNKYKYPIAWDDIFNTASEEGQLEILAWIVEHHRKYVDLYEGFRRACSKGRKSAADWIIEKNKKLDWKKWPIYVDMIQLEDYREKRPL